MAEGTNSPTVKTTSTPKGGPLGESIKGQMTVEPNGPRGNKGSK